MSVRPGARLTTLEESMIFLEAVWGEGSDWDSGEGVYVDLPSKVNGQWIPWIVEWPAAVAAQRLAACVRDHEDVYFSVGTFSVPRRSAECARSTRWLWADLDEVDPGSVFLRPTIAWQSSPGRYQALWRLKQLLSPQLQQTLNRALSYAVGADLGGWDVTQVLRIPGTRNFKYGDGVPVELLWWDDKVWDARVIYKRLLKTGAVLSAGSSPTPAQLNGNADASVSAEGLGDLVAGLPVRARRLLRAREAVIGERSARLWELECLLAEEGVPEALAFQLVWDTVWATKYHQRTNGEAACRQELRKAYDTVDRKRSDAVAPVIDEPTVDEIIRVRDASIPWEMYGDFLSREINAPPWLIDGVWSAGSHGIIGGEPKTCKSVLSLAMGLSVASGKRFLGLFDVVTTGPVLIVQEENAPWVVQDRARKIAASYGLLTGEVRRVGKKTMSGKAVEELEFPHDLPIRFLNNWGFTMTVDEHRDMLESVIQEVQPALVILDPLYLMIGGADTNVAAQLTPFLQWLLYLRYEYKTAVCVVHHMGKMNETQAGRRMGQRLAGSHVLHGWVESGLYSKVREETPGLVQLQVFREFRNVGSKGSLDLDLRMGQPGDLVFEASVGVDLQQENLRELVSSVGEKGATLKAVAEMMGVDKRTALKRLKSNHSFTLLQDPDSRTWRVYPAGRTEADPVEVDSTEGEQFWVDRLTGIVGSGTHLKQVAAALGVDKEEARRIVEHYGFRLRVKDRKAYGHEVYVVLPPGVRE